MLTRSASGFMKLWTVIVVAGAALLAGTAAQGQAPVSMSAPPVGEAAPQFRLQDQNGKWVSLAEQKGKWVVLYFYPKDQTPGCTTEACEFRDDVFTFRKANAVILGVSVDDVDSHKAFSEKHGLPFSLLADHSKETARRYGVLISRNEVEIARRDTFLIDPSGKLVKHYEGVKPEGHSKTVLADIETLKGAKAATG
jgi:thioredoxin-dependent peroxiredoxin